MDGFDFNNSGGLDFGDITSGFSKATDYIGGLFDSAPTQSSMANEQIMKAVQSGYSPQEITSMGKNFTDLGYYNTPSSGGGFNFGSIGTGFNKGLDFLTKHKDAIQVGGGLLGAYGDYKTARDANALTKRLIDAQLNEQQRQIAKEKESISEQREGFESSGLFNPNEKKQQTSNYYSV